MFAARSHRKLERRRVETLLGIREHHQRFEEMVQRATRAGQALDDAFLIGVRAVFSEIEQKASDQAVTIDELDALSENAEMQRQFSAYVCPQGEIQDEGNLHLAEMEEWNVPKPVIAKLRATLGKKLDGAAQDLESARGALRALFEEYDSWADYTDDYEVTMNGYSIWLVAVTIIVLPLAILAIHFRPTIIAGLVLSGLAGACVSVMAKMPVLDVSLSGALNAYGRRVLSRIGIGVTASLIGSALLGWGLLPISIQNQTFADLLNACAGPPAEACGEVKGLVLVGVTMLFGFSERALTSFEQKVFGSAASGRRGAAR